MLKDTFHSDTFDLSKYIKDKQKIINNALSNIVDRHFENNRLCNAMKYSLMASGKRLRPILCMAAADAVGGIDNTVITASCAIEFIHTYSLIHDDLPAMDDDVLRRGIPTCHVKFDEATAILAGDALLTIAFELLSSQIFQFSYHSPEKLIEIIFFLSKAAGYKGMIEGQMRDISGETQQMTLEELKEMHYLKTGALIEASVKIGALLCNASYDQIHHLEMYARNIGLAFQIVDDILNIEGDPKIMGKATGTDQDRSKTTYPGLVGLKQSKEHAQELISNAVQMLFLFGNKATPLSELARYILQRKR